MHGSLDPTLFRQLLEALGGTWDHTTLYDTSPFVSLITEFELDSVYTDLAMSGHDKRKTTHFIPAKDIARIAFATVSLVKGMLEQKCKEIVEKKYTIDAKNWVIADKDKIVEE